MSDSAHLVAASITIAAPPATVFQILADARQHSRIDGSGTVGAILVAPDRLERGSQFSVRMRLFGMPYRITNRVVEFEQDRLIAWRHFGGHRWRYRLTPTGDGGVEVTETFDYSRLGAARRAFLRLTAFPRRNRAGIVATLGRLKEAAEADAAFVPAE